MNRVRRAAFTSLLALAAAGIVAACLPAPSRGPSGQPPGSPGTTPGGTTTTNLPSQSDTEWGRIWDAIPASFPQPPDAQPATDTGDGPSSAQLQVGSGTRDEIARLYLDALRDAGYSVGRDGPLEDGSVVVSATDGYLCRIQVTVRPVAAASIVTVRYGAGCPFA